MNGHGDMQEVDPFGVGVSFAQAYYDLLHQEPTAVCRFFASHSTFTFSDGDEVAPMQTGPADVRAQLSALHLVDVKTDVKSIDCQPSLRGSVLVVVHGILYCAHQVPKRFSQTFLLAKAKASFYVVNSSFRYITDYYGDEGLAVEEEEPAEQEEPWPAEQGAHEPIEDEEEAVTAAHEGAQEWQGQTKSQEAAQEGWAQAPASTDEPQAVAQEEEEPEPEVEPELEPEPEPEPEPEQAAEPAEPEPEPEEEETQEPEPVVPEPPAPQAPPQPAPSAPQQPPPVRKAPTNYAEALTIGNKAKPAPSQVRTVVGGAPAATAAPATAASPPRPAAPRQREAGTREPGTGKGKGAGGKGGKGGKGQPQESRFGIFIGKLPEDVTDSELREAFAQFGDVVGVRNRAQKRIAFIDFASLEAQAKAIEAGSGKAVQLRGSVLSVQAEDSNISQESRGKGKGKGSGGYMFGTTEGDEAARGAGPAGGKGEGRGKGRGGGKGGKGEWSGAKTFTKAE